MVGSTPPGTRMSRRQQEARRAAVEDGALIDAAYYQSMFINHNVSQCASTSTHVCHVRDGSAAFFGTDQG